MQTSRNSSPNNLNIKRVKSEDSKEPPVKTAKIQQDTNNQVSGTTSVQDKAMIPELNAEARKEIIQLGARQDYIGLAKHKELYNIPKTLNFLLENPDSKVQIALASNENLHKMPNIANALLDRENDAMDIALAGNINLHKMPNIANALLDRENDTVDIALAGNINLHKIPGMSAELLNSTVEDVHKALAGNENLYKMDNLMLEFTEGFDDKDTLIHIALAGNKNLHKMPPLITELIDSNNNSIFIALAKNENLQKKLNNLHKGDNDSISVIDSVSIGDSISERNNNQVDDTRQSIFQQDIVLYNMLHDDIKSKLAASLSNTSIQDIADISKKTSSISTDLDVTISGINIEYGHDFEKFKRDTQSNPLSPYVVALDYCTESRPQDSIFIHAAATLEAYDKKNIPIIQKDISQEFTQKAIQKYILKKAKNIMMAAVAVSRVYSDFENVMRPTILDKYRLSDGTINPEKFDVIDNDLKDTLPDYMKNYKAVIDHYGSAPFFVRTGARPTADTNQDIANTSNSEFTHYGSIIIEKFAEKHQIRFADPLADKDVVYKIQDGKLNDVLLRLHDIYSNGSPNNNLEQDNIDASIFEKGTLNEEETTTIDRTPQTGTQCGIHSSRRIIPKNIYDELGIDDCDIAKLVNI